jgi:glycosyltransferase involved in cell wall biosynthesis
MEYSREINNHFIGAKKNLVILDDAFPYLLSAFRIAEYNEYLKRFANAKVYTSGSVFSSGSEIFNFSRVYLEYAQRYPNLAKRVFPYEDGVKISNSLVYTIFLNNIYSFIDVIENENAPFIFTLYPGGGFQLNNPESDIKLKRVFSSTCFRKVIVTQKITYDYLCTKKLCRPDRIKFLYGGVLPSDQLFKNLTRKKFYRLNKRTFDICFVANKYTKYGQDKGYDIFIEIAKKLAFRCSDLRFHVVGGFNSGDLDIKRIYDKIRFYGTRYTDFFPKFYSEMDIILSPNVPFKLAPGAFDGFPTGACIEAGLCGVAVFCTDILGLNVAFKEDEITIISRDTDNICQNIENFYRDPQKLYEKARKGQGAFKRIFKLKAQMNPRIGLIENELYKSTVNSLSVTPSYLSGRQPFVSIAIPSYNARYFSNAVESALRQNYRNFEIVICDDCPNDEIFQCVNNLNSPFIKYYRNIERKGSYNNLIECFNKTNGEYIKFLNDDDLLNPKCLERMSELLLHHKNVSLVTSYRKCIDKDGRPLSDFAATQPVVSENSIIDGLAAGNTMLVEGLNFIGEPSTVMFRKADLVYNKPNILSFAGNPVTWNSDVAMWLTLLSKGNLIYLIDALSFFRLHDEQEQRISGGMERGIKAWQQLRRDCKKMGFFRPRNQSKKMIRPLKVLPINHEITGINTNSSVRWQGLRAKVAFKQRI